MNNLKKVIVPVFTISITFLFLSCELKNTVVPSWETKATVPLITKSFTSLELISESDTAIKTDNFNNYYYFDSKEINPVTFDNKIKISDKTENGTATLDSLKIGGLNNNLSISFGKLKPALSVLLHNKLITVEPFAIPLRTQSFPKITQFEYAVLDEFPVQNIVLTAKNEMPIPVDNLTFSIKSVSSGVEIASGTFPLIAKNDSSSKSISVGGKTLTGDMKIEITGHSDGSPSTPVKLDSTKGLKFGLISKDLRIKEAKAQIIATEFSTKDSIEIEEDKVTAKEVTIRSGNMQININNSSEIAGFADISSPQLKNSAGTPFQQSIPIKAKQSSTPFIIPLDNYILDFPDKPIVRFNLKIRISASTVPAVVKKTDIISYTTKLTNVKPLKVIGNFKETADSNEPDTSTISYPKELDGVDLFFDKGTIDATIFNGLGVPVKVSPVIVFLQKNGVLDTVKFGTGVFPVTLHASVTPGIPQKFTKALALSDIPGLSEKFNQHPAKVWFFGNATAAPGGYNNGFIYDTSSVRGTVKFSVPLRVKSNTGFKKETTSTFTPESFTGIQNAQLNIHVTNKVPFRTAFRISFLGVKNDTLLTFPKKSETSEYREIPQPPLKADGSVSSALETEIVPFVLSRTELDLMEKSVKVVLKIRIFTSNSTSGNFIQLNSADQLKFIVYSTIGAKINE